MLSPAWSVGEGLSTAVSVGKQVHTTRSTGEGFGTGESRGKGLAIAGRMGTTLRGGGLGTALQGECGEGTLLCREYKGRGCTLLAVTTFGVFPLPLHTVI